MSIFIRRILRWSLFLLWTLLVSFVLLEGTLRIIGYASANIYDPIYMPYAGSAEIPYVHKPDLRGVRGRGHALFDTDGLGLRTDGKQRPGGPNTKTIAIVGDSVTFGEGVERTEDTYCQVLQRELNRRLHDRSFSVKNFGVSAYSVREMAATVETRVPAVRPDLVVLAMITHDLRLTRTPEVDRYGYHYNQRLSGWMAKDSRLKKMLRHVRTAYLIREFRSRLANRGTTRGDDRAAQPLEPGFGYLARFHRYCTNQGLPHLVLLLPELDPAQAIPLRRALEKAGIPFVDLSRIREEFSFEDYCAGRGNRHPSAAVHATIGKRLAAALAPLFESD